MSEKITKQRKREKKYYADQEAKARSRKIRLKVRSRSTFQDVPERDRGPRLLAAVQGKSGTPRGVVERKWIKFCPHFTQAVLGSSPRPSSARLLSSFDQPESEAAPAQTRYSIYSRLLN